MKNKTIHLIASIVVFSIPLLLSVHSGVEQITIGAILNAIYLKASQFLVPTERV